ncbi:MAG: DUF4445 domain-containing protein [Chloroflexota bacterium]|nr:DUF4445 domain-containing protein [Chloroflexota bacterium]
MAEEPLCRIDFQPIGKRVEVASGTSLFDAARQAGVGLATVCGGQGNCGRCRVTVMTGQISAPTEADERFLSPEEIGAGQRLACRTRVFSNVKIHIPKASLVTDQRLQVGGLERRVQVEAAVAAFEVEAPPPSLHDPRSDLGRVAGALEAAHGLRDLSAQPNVLRMLSALARSAGWRITAYVRGREIVGFQPPGRKPVGFACDLGTTKIAGYLVDLESGEELAAAGVMNPQIGYGEDVISRLAHATKTAEGAAELARLVREAIDGLAGALAEQAGLERDQIVDACIVGNTAMTHLLLELPVRQLATAPFVAAAGDALDVKAQELGLHLAPGAYVHVPSCIGGFVGADHVAMVLAGGLDQGEEVALGVDIGTNTEIVLHHPGRGTLTSASCASGPAFEGAHIRDGMRAAPGAIEAVRITPDGVETKTIDGAPAVGICGSGIVDAMAELRRSDKINDRGRMQTAAAGVRRQERGGEYPLVLAEHSGTGRDIVITQHDVNEIQLAKGAVRAGIETLLETTHTAPDEVRTVIIAGAFGSYLNIDSTLAIGLLPRFPNARYLQVGNAAGVGAKLMLLSLPERRRAREMARETGYLELTTTAGFSRRFARAMLFLPPDSITTEETLGLLGASA